MSGTSREHGHPTCYAQTHLKGPGYMAVCQQVSNAIAVDDPEVVTCDICLESVASGRDGRSRYAGQGGG